MKILVVDDHPVFRDGLVALLRTLPDVEIAGLAGDADAAVELVAAGGVDVVLMDLNLPGRSGIAATAAIVARPDPPAVLVVTMVDDDGTVASALRAGARGYLLKGSSGQQIADAVRAVAGGGVVLGPGVATHLLTAPTPTADPDGLTAREREILSLLAEGASNAQIARTLGLSLKTVQNYTSRVLAKLQVADRTQAALYVRRPGPPVSPGVPGTS